MCPQHVTACTCPGTHVCNVGTALHNPLGPKLGTSLQGLWQGCAMGSVHTEAHLWGSQQPPAQGTRVFKPVGHPWFLETHTAHLGTQASLLPTGTCTTPVPHSPGASICPWPQSLIPVFHSLSPAPVPIYCLLHLPSLLSVPSPLPHLAALSPPLFPFSTSCLCPHLCHLPLSHLPTFSLVPIFSPWCSDPSPSSQSSPVPETCLFSCFFL